MKKQRLLIVLIALSTLAACEAFQPREKQSSTHTDPVPENVVEPAVNAEQLRQQALAEQEALAQERALAKQKALAMLAAEAKKVAEQAALDKAKALAELLAKEQAASSKQQVLADTLCQLIGNKLGSVDTKECLSQGLQHSGLSTRGKSLAYRDYSPVKGKTPLGRVLVIGGIHGDEFSSVSVMFKWMNILNKHHSGLLHWRFVPSLNPDGLLERKSKRQNANGVDLNRNFPTADWQSDAKKYWASKAGKNPRRYPGEDAASETETLWLIEQIETFKPDVILSMHAPYHLVDYDGPPKAPAKLGGLYLRKLGVYPGSLGNYAGVDLQLPIVTVELKSAGIMPSDKEIDQMWSDLVSWLKLQLDKS